MSLIPRFFKVKPEQITDHGAVIVSKSIDLALDMLTDYVTLHTFDDGDLLIYGLIKRHNKDGLDFNTEVDDALTMAGVLEMGLEDTYKGMEYSDVPYTGVFWFCPELAGTRTETDEEGNEFEVNILRRVSWGATL